jgi:hypothetical protein
VHQLPGPPLKDEVLALDVAGPAQGIDEGSGGALMGSEPAILDTGAAWEMNPLNNLCSPAGRVLPEAGQPPNRVINSPPHSYPPNGT